ncbi:MAG TPA: DUF6351 family protein [Caldimonas sp.]|nr:DUF6351 family protein [Caldimonas sp.]
MKFQRSLAAFAAAFASFVLFGCGGDNNGPPPTSGTMLTTLSNRADLVSGGSALVEVQMPSGSVRPASLKIDRDGTDITASFITLASGRIVGLVTGLKNGTNTINATFSDGTFVGASLVINNHPIGGPVLLGSQAGPWVCATPIPVVAVGNTPASNGSGLSTAATDAQCNIATEFKLWYRTKTPVLVTAGDGGCSFVLPDPTPSIANPTPATPANSCFQPYVAGTTPAASVASTTTTTGRTVPYIVRVERGTINRGIYDIAVLFDPTAPAWTATAPQPQWNGKVLVSYGASTGQPRQQFRTEQNWADDTALSRGFMVVDNSLTDSLYNSSRTLAAETTMMMKEHIVDTYGEIVFTMANGCSGGSIGQNTVSSIYPGLLDGIQPSCDFPDSITTGIEVTDCVLLVNLYVKPEWTALMAGLTQAQINAKKAAINGHRDQLGCHGWNNSFGFNNKPGNYVRALVADATGTVVTDPSGPRNNCLLPAALVYNPTTNPAGPRCGDPDLAAAVWGTTANTAAGVPAGNVRAQTTGDNVGVQYGLKALLSSAITAEEFVTLNEKIGGSDPDSNLSASRSVADAGALDIAYKSGILSSGKNLGMVAIIDSRGYDEGPGSTDIHYNWRSFEERSRLDTQAGDHNSQVIWRYGTALLPATAAQIAAVTTKSFLTMDTWLTTLNAQAPKPSLNSARTHAQVVAAKPAAAIDFCFLTGDVNFATPVTDQAACDADLRLKVFSSPHQVAGGPLAENILKCQLKPVVFSDYTGITFTAGQQARLNAVFPTGVCDWSKPGVGQQDPIGPLTYTAGPGGVPLPAAPTSVPI